MSDVLAHIRVKETHGIRRFLYPLSTSVNLPEGTDVHRVALCDEAGQSVPLQLTPEAPAHYFRLSFAVSLAPQETLELTLRADADPAVVKDPLNITEKDGIFHNQQERFSVDFTSAGDIANVVYDGVHHLRKPSCITLNGIQALPGLVTDASFAVGKPLEAEVRSWVSYPIHSDEKVSRPPCGVEALTNVTACKSWIRVVLDFWFMYEGDEVVFSLPLQAASSTLFYDFGVGGGIYGKLQQGVTETVKWETTQNEEGFKWNIETQGRVDYEGVVADWQDYHRQSWFHIIDTDKALAIAITDLPDACSSVTAALDYAGNIRVAFRMGYCSKDDYSFGVCYHFLNDVPAIAAATNPQSILLPPTVEVLAA